jgi:hypothetical protein
MLDRPPAEPFQEPPPERPTVRPRAEPLELGRPTEPARAALFPKRPTVRVGEGVVAADPRVEALPVRDGFARGWRTSEASGRERGTALVSVGLFGGRAALCTRAALG